MQSVPVASSMLALVVALATTAAAGEAASPLPGLVDSVADILSQDYYDPSRVRPRLMVERALRNLETAEMDLDTVWQGGEIRILRHGETHILAAPDPADLHHALALVDRVAARLVASGMADDRSRDLLYHMLNGALSSLDPHTGLLPPRPASRFTEDIAGEFFGIGAYLNQEDGIIRIERVMPGLPADQAGVEDGDIILQVDGERTVGLSLPQTVRRIKGPKGTTVTLTVERAKHKEPLDIAIVRDLVQVITMRSYRQGAIGYVRMDEFNRNTARDLFAELMALQASGPLSGFVLDLRTNGGGLLKQARVISDFFLPAGREIVRTVALGDQPRRHFSGRRTILDVPMVILVSPGSASASEILSGALKVNNRAVVAGATTFGKGSVQTVRGLDDGSTLKFTIQEYQLADGISIQERGVVPDLELERHVAIEGEIDLRPYSASREGDNEFALHAGGGDDDDSSLHLAWLQESEDEETRRRARISARDYLPDQEARLVIDLLDEALAAPGAAAVLARGRAGGDLRQATLNLLAPAVNARERAESRKLAALLDEEAGLDWGQPVVTAANQLTIEWLGPETVTAGDEATLRFRIANRAATAVGHLYGLVQAEDGSPFWEDEMVVGAVPAHGSVEREMTIAVPPRLHSGQERFSLDLFRFGHDEPLARTTVDVAVAAQPRPHLSYRWRLIDADQGIRRDVDSSLELTVRNDGDAPSAPLSLFVFKDDDPFVQLSDGRFRLDAIAAGAEVVVTVPFRVASKPPPGLIDRNPPERLRLQIRAEERFGEGVDDRHAASFYHVLSLPIGDGDAVLMGDVQVPRLAVVERRRSPAGLHLGIEVVDDNPHLLAVFRNQEKVALERLTEAGRIDLTVPLEAGFNAIDLIVRDDDTVDQRLPLRVWSLAPPDLADRAQGGADLPDLP